MDVAQKAPDWDPYAAGQWVRRVWKDHALIRTVWRRTLLHRVAGDDGRTRISIDRTNDWPLKERRWRGAVPSTLPLECCAVPPYSTLLVGATNFAVPLPPPRLRPDSRLASPPATYPYEPHDPPPYDSVVHRGGPPGGRVLLVPIQWRLPCGGGSVLWCPRRGSGRPGRVVSDQVLHHAPPGSVTQRRGRGCAVPAIPPRHTSAVRN